MKGGFTLAEVMVAVVIMAIGLLALVGVYIFALRATASGQLHQQAVVCADSVAQQVSAALANPAPDRKSQLAGLVARRPDPEHSGAIYAVDLTPGPSVPGPIQRSLTIEVYWSDSSGPHSFTVRSEFYDQAAF